MFGANLILGAGATVYCTGRTTRLQPSELNRPETIEETTDLVGREGGRGIAAQVDLVCEELGEMLGLTILVWATVELIASYGIDVRARSGRFSES